MIRVNKEIHFGLLKIFFDSSSKCLSVLAAG